MNFDFLAMNLTGFSFYSIYCTYGYFNPAGKEETGQVDLNDLFFAYHALLITILTVVQAFIFQRGKNRIMFITIGYLCAMWLFCMIYGSITLVSDVVNVGCQVIQPSSRPFRHQLHGLLQTVNIVPEVSATDVLELEEKIN